MGWASASEIFDPVAQALIDLGANPATKRRVLGTLLDKLRDADWDTWDYSLNQFRHDPTIVAIFYEQGCGNEIEGHQVDGLLGYDIAPDRWTLHCQGRAGCGLLDTAAGTVDGHDELVRAWAEHERAEHGGDGSVAEHMLLDQSEANH
jgi:hypothetical protein